MKVAILGCALTCLAMANGYGQQTPAANDNSLGDFARQLRAEKAKEPKPAKVFTNDNIPPAGMADMKMSEDTKTPAETSPGTSKPAGKKHDEAYYRSQMSTLRGNLDTHKRELDVLQQKLAQGQMQFYNDPEKSLMQQYTRDDVNKMTAEIDAKKQQIADDEKAIQNLHDQLRAEGGDPGWLR